MRRYDFIVIGIGGMGGAALYHLAQRGVRVLGLERFSIGHDRGSSHGGTRIIRRAYFEHPAYVPLLIRAYHLWQELEAQTGQVLLHRCGLLVCGPADGAVVAGVRRSAREHGIVVEELTPEEAGSRFPGFSVSKELTVLLEPEAGFLRVEACVRAHVMQALARGAELHEGERVHRVTADGTGVVIETDNGRYSAAGAVICGGPYSGTLLAELGLPLQVRRKLMFWYGVTEPAYRLERGCPTFAFDTPNGFFYGFPVHGPEGLKVAEHTGGAEVADPDMLDRSLRPGDEEPVRAFLVRHLPQAAQAPLQAHEACMYTMTPDEHFVIDRHPQHPQIVYAAGFSGHGFKFASVIGEVLADLAASGRTSHPIAFLSAARLLGPSSGR
ncbi:MAG: N-methyl-L-tryptophan oxidase [Myxococcales bacterium]|nr:N-methyl-L-tryptophan oxidase [Myxococcota bacterium]MDW8280116.1 N-methyl-L-tryptophan oxidase [Myxococcales bacterium]